MTLSQQVRMMLGLPIVLSMAFHPIADADQAESKISKQKQIEIISIFGQSQQLNTETGSAYYLNEEQLEQFEFDDIHRILQTVPGVYIREEDGYGLRPNIGLRGATTERSSKITIMEAGILIAPAPYAAPAAYYFPNSARMTGIEVFKGPAAISYGPNTVGGAINMHSRTISDINEGSLELAYGENNYQKLHSYYNHHIGKLGILVEGIRVSADGFKELDNGGDTGFTKNELLVKLNYEVDSPEYYQLWQLKLGYGDEKSHETYLGLTDHDFNSQPNRRYLASQNDLMSWQHQQIQLSHYIELNDRVNIHTVAYRRDFDRDWGKLNRLNTNRSIQTVLLSPDTGLNKIYYDVLTGARDSAIMTDTLMYGHNDRQYYSQGLQSKLTWQSQHFGADSQLEFGLRLHQDQVTRHHFEDGYLMLNKKLVATNQPTIVSARNKGQVTALASYLNYQLDFEQLTVKAGLRVENIDGQLLDKKTQQQYNNKDTLVSPGLGAFYRFNDQFGLLAGVNKGFVPNSPGQSHNSEQDIKAEERWNYEFGLRYSNQRTKAELIGFYTDYSNLKGRCTFSSGCVTNIDIEFNGGSVNVQGIEASFSSQWSLTNTIDIPFAISYTLTDSSFNSDFKSSFIQWGDVKKGDQLPYMPKNQLSIKTGLTAENWQLALLFKHTDKMSEAAGSRTDLEGYWTDQQQQIDFSAWYQLTSILRIYGKIDNLTNKQVVVSRRPLGARPGKPQQMIVGIKFKF